MRIPIISGTRASESGDFLESFPINREPILKNTGISEGYLAVPPGITQIGMGPGADRGGINWNGVCYRVMGTSLVTVTVAGVVSILGDVGAGGVCGFSYSFVNLIINSGTRLYYWNQTDGLRQVADPDLGPVVDAIFVDGYTMTTDGEFLVVTDLNDPMAVDPIKYGSSEVSPDAVTGLATMHGEVYALNRFTIQVFQNVGGTGFPFVTLKTATIGVGCVGPRAKCEFLGTLAFVGNQERAAPGIYLMGAGEANKVSAAEVDDDLAALTEEELAAVWVEARVSRDEQRLIVHLPERSWCFSTQVSSKSAVKTWCQYVTSKTTSGRYEGRGLVYVDGKWVVGASDGRLGVLDPLTAQHYGEDVGWQIETAYLYNESNGAIVNALRLIGTPGRGNADSRIFFSYTKDGQVWSMERATSAGTLGQRGKRVGWRLGFRMEDYIGLRFRGVDGSLMGIAALEAEVEALAA